MNFDRMVSLWSVLFLVLALMGPWFTLSVTTTQQYRDEFQESGDLITLQTQGKESYYLDKAFVKLIFQEGQKSFWGVDAETESKSGSYIYYDETLEATAESGEGLTETTFSFMYGLYKVFLLIALLRFMAYLMENLESLDSLADTMLSLVFGLMIILIISFLLGFTESYIVANETDRVILDNKAKNEPDVNMTLIVGTGVIVDEDYNLLYYSESTGEEVYSDQTTTALWYPSWGFVMFFISALLTYESRQIGLWHK